MDTLLIPKQLHAGFQEREDTYSGKLAFIIFTDHKGKKRKEYSWSHWINDAIPVDDFENEPTTGFVLNRNGGGARESYGWNPRNEFIRVFHPRGFEFEISLANLLFILEHGDSIKGKGLTGKFVLAWDRTQMILLPTNTDEYKKSAKFTALQTKKVTRKDMVEGGTYVHKNTNHLVYLGPHKVRPNIELRTITSADDFTCERKRKHVFWDMTDEKFIFETGYTRLGNVLSTESHPDYADLYTKFTDSLYIADFTLEAVPVTAAEVLSSKGTKLLIKLENDRYAATRFIETRPDAYWGRSRPHSDHVRTLPDLSHKSLSLLNLGWDGYIARSYGMPFDELKTHPMFTVRLKATSGTLLPLYYYV